ncbi:hypothetical protein [Streptococcus pneumoniae]|uniref:hypothetical protein n=1 Tax=Streptococcus pneumoniae TaxID=1313 RepID=UPI0012434A09|nr:hypothetical protein [Streptococcus pneumoniae]
MHHNLGNSYSIKIKKQTRKLGTDCSKHRFKVVDRTDEVSSKHCFEVVDRTDEVSNHTPKSAQNTVLRLWIELTKSVTIPMTSRR